MLSSLDKKIISFISNDIGQNTRPFQRIASKIGISEDKLLERMKYYRKTGFMRKFYAVLNHRKIGFKYNAMTVWDVPQESVENAGEAIALFSSVSHCYERPKKADWPYNLYAMIHARTRIQCLAEAKRVSEKIGFLDYKLLFSVKEYKKTGVKY